MQLLHGSIPKQSVVQRPWQVHLQSNETPGQSGNGADEMNRKDTTMAVIAQARSTTAEAGLRGRLLTAIQRMQENRARRAVYRQTVRELNALTTRDLDDLGISRSMITRLAHEAAWGSAS
ncbi:DUF1127 domain-containing protein [Paracoccus gahaiensis]|nr:DUF1127 domain-containing protein [Paracoccus gahaiensis]